MAIEIGYIDAKNIADAHEKPYITDSTLHEGIPNSEHCEMDFYNNEMGRQLGLAIQKYLGRKDYDTIAQVLYNYAMSQDAYFRITPSGIIRSIEESRPNNFVSVMQMLNQ